MRDKIKQKTIEIIAEQLTINQEEISEGAHFADDLGADSLDLTEMIMAFEEEFDVEIEDEEAAELPKVKDVIDKLVESTTTA